MLLGVVAHKGGVVGVGELVLATVVGHAVAASGRFVRQNGIEHNAFVTRDRSWARRSILLGAALKNGIERSNISLEFHPVGVTFLC